MFIQWICLVLSFFAISCISSGQAQYIGAVRCYVCRSIAYNKGLDQYANCPDVYDTKTTTITYCKACVKYDGGIWINGNPNGTALVRACYNKEMYEGTNGSIPMFPKQALTHGRAPEWDLYPAYNSPVNLPVQIWKNPNKQPVSYMNGSLYICNDGDLCNGASAFSIGALTIVGMFFLMQTII